MAQDDWWRQAVVYQVYPRSFRDADGDGLGDLRGVARQMGYLAALGVDAIWLSPFYPSELADGGYDVADYRDVDPRLGTLADFDAMLAAAHAAGLRVIVDIVPNHTSRLHPWFQEALASAPGSPARDRYLFRDGRGPAGELPPNDWQSLFGGSAWERADAAGDDGAEAARGARRAQWYLHLFAREQPDLNWENPEVRADFERTLRFWADRGVDGFRIDVAHGMAKDLDSAPLEELGRWPVANQLNPGGDNPLWDRDGVHEIYRAWRRVFNEYDPPRFAVAEAWICPEHQARYASPDELGQVFNFEFAKADWNAADFRRAIEEGLATAEASGSTTTWVLSNHDIPRHATRFALPQVSAPREHQLAIDWLLRDGATYAEDRALGSRRARAAILLELALPGSIYLYQGEELGLFEVPDIPWDRLEDPTAFHTAQATMDKGRDGCRVPLPWVAANEPSLADFSRPIPADDGTGENRVPLCAAGQFGTGASFGFSPAVRADGVTPAADPHLPQPLWFKDFAVDVEQADPDSMFALYRAALSIRQESLTSTRDTSAEQVNMGDDVVAYTRVAANGRTFTSVTNFGDAAIALPEGDVVLTSGPLTGDGQLPTDTSAWVLR